MDPSWTPATMDPSKEEDPTWKRRILYTLNHIHLLIAAFDWITEVIRNRAVEVCSSILVVGYSRDSGVKDEWEKTMEVAKDFEDLGLGIIIPILMMGVAMKTPRLQLTMILASSSLTPVPTAANQPVPAYLSQEMKSRLNHQPPADRYAHGVKMTALKALGEGSTQGKDVAQLVEMAAIIFTTFNIDLDVLEKLVNRNMDILIAAYPGKINCGGSATCESRKNVLMEAFRQAIDVYANIQWSFSSLCQLKKAHIPLEVIAANSRVGRPLGDSKGYEEAEYVAAGQYLNEKLGGKHLTFIQTKDVLSRAKRNPFLGGGMALSIVASIARLVKTYQLEGQVSALELDLKAMDIKLEASIRMSTEALQKLGRLITENAEIDQVGQVQTLSRLAGEEMYSIIGSMEHGKLDRAAEREAGKVARRVARKAAVGMSRGEVQDHISMVARPQGSTVDITHVGDSRMCVDSSKKVTLMTPEPLINGAVGFLETSEDIYVSTAKILDGITYYVNPYSSIGTTFQRNGETMKLVPRVVQAHPGTRLVFRKPDNVLTDQFTVYFDDRVVATLGTQCGDIQKGVQDRP